MKGPKTIKLQPAAEEEDVIKDYIIKEASIKDDFCNYQYEIIEGTGAGDKHNVKGSGIVLKDMLQAFGKLHVHIACIDDVFTNAKVEIDDIDKFHAHEITGLYNVTGIKVRGSKHNERVILIGSKFVNSSSGRIALVTPAIPMDDLSSYKWYNELKTAVDKIREEVRLYKEGKYEAVEDEAYENPRQLKITDNIEEGEEGF
jgi:hypothetical protein